MKILSLTFSNLNSLKGNWHIDFDNSAFIHDGIFAITGRTGAGKTTILDAICLAIYGQTPRINAISNNHNELMSIDRGECHSEVVVLISTKTEDKLYRFSFGQRRAGGKADGKLQPIKREISLLKHPNDKGEIIEVKPSLCDKKAIEIMHMNFEQFTRSVMLAQGNFSAFLKAETNEKGEILEQITGTEIYAKISQKTFEIYKQKREELNILEQKLNENIIIDDDEFIKLQNIINSNQETIENNKKILDSLDKNIYLLQDKNKAEQEIAKYQEVINDEQKKILDFNDKSSVLKNANHAHQIEPTYQELLREQDTLTNTTLTLNESKSKLPPLINKITDLKSKSNKCQHTLDEHKQKYQESLSLFKKIRELDVSIRYSFNQLDKINHDTNECQKLILNSTNTIHKLNNSQNTLSIELNEFHAQISQEQYTNIKQDLGIIKGFANQLTHHINQLTQLNNCIHKQTNELNLKNNEISQKRELLKNKKDSLVKSNDNHQMLTNKIRTLCQRFYTDNHDVLPSISNYESLFQEEIYTSNHILSIINALDKERRVYHDINQQLSELEQHIKNDEQKKSNIELHINETTQTLNEENNTLNSLKNTHKLQQELLVLQQYHKKLVKDEPCPLCGSLKHPYADHHPFIHSVDDDITNAIQYTTQKIDKLTRTNQDQKETLINLATRIEYHQAQYEQLTKQYRNTINVIKEYHQQINQHGTIKYVMLGDDLLNIDNYISTLKVAINEHLKSLNHDHKEFKHLESMLLDSQHAIDIINQEIDNITQNGKILSERISFIEDNIHQDKENSNSTLVVINNIIHEINQKFVIYQQPNIHEPNNTSLQQVQENIYQISELDAKLDNCYNKKQQLEKQLNDNYICLHNEQKQLNHQQTQLENLTKQLNAAKTEYNNLATQRQQLFMNKNVDDEEHFLRTQIEQTQLEFNHVNQEYQNYQQEHYILAQKIHDDNNRLLAINKNINRLHQQIEEWLVASPFNSFEEFLSSRLPDDKRLALQQEEQNLFYKLKQAQDNHLHWQNELNQLVATHQDICTLNLNQLINNKEQLQNSHYKLLTQFGEQRQKLIDACHLREKRQSLLTLIEQKQQDLKIWAKLDELIGSKEGIKYRNFVQGLTLELMLHHANDVLSKMDDRYILIHNNQTNKNPLDISVIDIAQGSEIRSTKNLSGGESFIISLALAMGLSQMSSENISINSLFLDEGFGTLDDEVLDIALSALSSLKDTGKMIGIISHVQSLKNRIPTQIHVKKQANGESILFGSGVQKIQ